MGRSERRERRKWERRNRRVDKITGKGNLELYTQMEGGGETNREREGGRERGRTTENVHDWSILLLWRSLLPVSSRATRRSTDLAALATKKVWILEYSLPRQ